MKVIVYTDSVVGSDSTYVIDGVVDMGESSVGGWFIVHEGTNQQTLLPSTAVFTRIFEREDSEYS